MSYKDLREFIIKLEQEGELQRIKAEVDWDVEIGAIIRKINKSYGPACLFEKVKDSKYRVLSGGMLGHKKYGLAIESPPDLRSLIKKVMMATDHPTPPVMVKTGPCKENIDTGDKINLEKFPVPRWHYLDGGRYIGTLGAVITKDPDTGIRNVAVYREQILGKNKTGLTPFQQGGVHLQKYRDRNKPMPIATAIGVPPAVLCAAVVHAPYGQDELGIAGTLAGEPIPLVKCETIDLEVPAYSEIVLEGEIPANTELWEDEGPFGEYTGYFSTLDKIKRPTVYLKAVTYRDDPIYQGTQPGIPPNEDTSLKEIGSSAGLWRRLSQTGIPGIQDVYLSETGCPDFTAIVSMNQVYYLGQVRQVIDSVFALSTGAKWVIVVDDDIDIYDRGQVEWALAVRVQPHRDIVITDGRYPGAPLDPSIEPALRRFPNVYASMIGIDATTKFKGYQFPPMVVDNEEQRKLVERRWKEYGFK